MQKVLVIAYQFPPMGGSGVQRTVKFVKYLGQFGWKPVVFTRKAAGMALRDETLLEEIPAGMEIIRTRPYDLTSLPGPFGIAGKAICRKIMIPDGERLWQLMNTGNAIDALRHDIRLIYTTSYPYSDHLIGLKIRKRYPGIPWVADFRDEWTNNPYLIDKPYNRIRMSIEHRMEKDVLAAADHIIANTPVMLDNFLKNTCLPSSKFSVIANGFDEDDYKEDKGDMPDNPQFTVTYTGALYGRRKPDTFLEALGRLTVSGKINPDSITVRLIGNFKNESLSKTIERYSLSSQVSILPYMDHKKCISELIRSDALLLIEGAGPGGEAFYTGKIFEYMNTGRPIIAVIPENGAAAGLIRESRTGLVSDSLDVEKTSENIYMLYKTWKTGTAMMDPDWEMISRFSRKALTGKLAMIFDSLI